MCMVVVHTTMSTSLRSDMSGEVSRVHLHLPGIYFSLQDSNSGSSFLGRNLDGVLFLVGVLRFVGDE